MEIQDIIKGLKAEFSPDQIHWRVGSTTKDKTRGMALCYVDARDVMNRLDEVCGPENWQDKIIEHGKRVICSIGIKLNGEWVWKSDGAGDTSYEAEKGAISDAFKRAAVKWGIARYLYETECPWVAVVSFGNSVKIADHETERLQKIMQAKVDTPPPLTEDQRQSVESIINDFYDCVTVQELEAEAAGKKAVLDALPELAKCLARTAFAKKKADLQNSKQEKAA